MDFEISGFYASLKDLSLDIKYEESHIAIGMTVEGLLRLRKTLSKSIYEDVKKPSTPIECLGCGNSFFMVGNNLNIFRSNMSVMVNSKYIKKLFDILCEFNNRLRICFSDEQIIKISEKYKSIYDFRANISNLLKDELLK